MSPLYCQLSSNSLQVAKILFAREPFCCWSLMNQFWLAFSFQAWRLKDCFSYGGQIALGIAKRWSFFLCGSSLCVHEASRCELVNSCFVLLNLALDLGRPILEHTKRKAWPTAMWCFDSKWPLRVYAMTASWSSYVLLRLTHLFTFQGSASNCWKSLLWKVDAWVTAAASWVCLTSDCLAPGVNSSYYYLAYA